MAKVSGLGDNFYVSGFDVSLDTANFKRIGGGPNPLDMTSIAVSGHERFGGLRSATMEWDSFMDPALGASHAAFSPLPTVDQISTWFKGPVAIGGVAASTYARQINYDGTRAADGMLTFALQEQSDGFGLEFGLQLTAGKRTDTAATNGASNNDGAATNFGAQAYLHVFAFAGTDFTVTIQDSADNVTFANLSPSFTFSQVTAAPAFQRVAILNNATLRQYVRAITTTVGGFTSATFAVQYTRNTIAGQVF